MGDCWLRTFVRRGKLVGNFVQLFRQRVIEGIAFQHVTADHRMVGFLHLMLFKLLRQQPRHLAGQRHQQYPGCRTIKAMHGKHVLANLIAHGLHHKPGFMAIQPAAVYQPPGRLVHRHQMLILI
ncbi:hypothetical protein D3C78_1676180 [compost metagenome]